MTMTVCKTGKKVSSVPTRNIQIQMAVVYEGPSQTIDYALVRQ